MRLSVQRQLEVPTLYVLIGVSGSGKSTYAERFGTNTRLAIVSTDKIRKALYGDESDQRGGNVVFENAYSQINMYLACGKDVVFDATNTAKKGRERLLRAVRNPCQKVAVLLPADLNKAIEQNRMRYRIVPEGIVRRQYSQLIRDGESIPNQFDEIIFVK